MRFTVQKKYYDAILEGKKVYEGRLRNPKYDRLDLNEKVSFNCKDGRYLFAVITSIHIFPNFKAVFDVFNFKSLIPQAESVDEAVEVYRSFPGYYANEKRKKVFVFGFKVIKTSP